MAQSRAVSICPDVVMVGSIIERPPSKVLVGGLGVIKTIATTATSTIPYEDLRCCKCTPANGQKFPQRPVLTDTRSADKRLIEQEEVLRNEFAATMSKEMDYLKEKFDFILQNEQIRTSHMLWQAQREKDEKIAALQKQMECKNLAGLMYVMCAERTRCKFQKLQIIEQYTNYINMLNDILTEGQALILHLSRGYKSAARVNYEWEMKMKRIMAEFQGFVYHFAGGTPEQIQYFFDMPKLLHCQAFKDIDPNEDPIQKEIEEVSSESVLEEEDMEKQWWSDLESKDRPFVVFGDMADMKPPIRRETLRQIKAAKTAPKKWKEYVFHDMFVNSTCPNADVIKEQYFDRLPDTTKWECQAVSPDKNSIVRSEAERNTSEPDRQSMMVRRATTPSIDIRGNMGSILKIITATGLNQPVTKANLLGARDSMEISSSTRVRDRSKLHANADGQKISLFQEVEIMSVTDEVSGSPSSHANMTTSATDTKKEQKLEEETTSVPALDRSHNDSLQVINNHVPDRDHKLVVIKRCPMDKCQRMHMDEFMNSLPKYMHESPFTYIDQTFDSYETCTPEQLEILKLRLEEARKNDTAEKPEYDMTPLQEWDPKTADASIQTGTDSEMDLPPCTCLGTSTEDEPGEVYRMEDLIPVKLQIDRIKQECLFDEKIDFDRFKVIGQESEDSINRLKQQMNNPYAKNFTTTRLREIRNILKQHPSLCEIFQANAKC